MAHKHARGARRRPGSGVRKPRVTITGTLRVVRPGVAAVETAEGTFPVARGGIREAMGGDEVQVVLVHRGKGETQAVVHGVLQRATHTYLGTYEVAGPLGVVVALDARVRHDFFVLPEDHCAERLGVQEGDVVSARILSYPTRQQAGVVTIDRRIGPSSELDLAVEAVIASHGIATDFAPAALEQAKDLSCNVSEALAAEPARLDLRDLCTVTIDPVDARDFDDAVCAHELDDGGFELSVHIADVTHYVPWGSSIDLEARLRTCSTYLVDRVIPMLPERLCNEVCSLVPNEDRLCMSVTMRLDKRGAVKAAEAATSAIRSHARLSYDEADAFLSGTAGLDATRVPIQPYWRGEVGETLRVLDRVAHLRRELRRERGAIDFETREAKVVLDEEGRPVGVSVRERTAATSMVEEAMLLANECVAKMLSDADVASAYRVHERPSPEDLGATVGVLREFGLLKDVSVDSLVAGEPQAIQRVLEAAKGSSSEPLANALLLRAQKRAIYLPRNDGHYALAARAYCHFTSPIRRYPDTLVHRALKALLAGELDSRTSRAMQKLLPQLCRTCSDQERVADAASRDSQKVKMAELFATKVGECFSGVVVGVERYGLFVMLDDTCAEGLLPTRCLGEEWFTFDEERLALVGESTGRSWRLGQRVAVEVTGANPSRGQIDFALAGPRRA